MKLYRYSSITEHTKDNLKNNQIYFRSPHFFNDPYEFIFKFEIADEIYIDFLKIVYGDQFKVFLEKGMSKLEVLKHTRDHYFGQMYKLLGAVCFSENENNDIMWAHYGDNHRGICIEYDTTIPPLDLCEKIIYVNHVFPLSISDASDIEGQLAIKIGEAFLRKHILWNYEKEWRILSGADTLVHYPSEAIKSITFGFFCDKQNKQKIIELTSHLDIKYYGIVRSKDHYLTKKITYNK